MTLDSYTDFDEMQVELEAYRNGLDQLAWDKPAPGQPIHETHDRAAEPIYHLQHTYRGEPAWDCGNCLRITLGIDPGSCRGCGNPDNLTPYVHGPVVCRAVGAYDGPCLIGGGDGCVCPEDPNPKCGDPYDCRCHHGCDIP